MRIRWRLTWYGIGFTALSLAGFIVVIVILVEGNAAQDQDLVLAGIADEAAIALGNADTTDLDLVVPPLVPDAETSDQTFSTVYDEAGRVLLANGTVDGEPLALPAAVIVEALETGSSAADVGIVRVQARLGRTRIWASE